MALSQPAARGSRDDRHDASAGGGVREWLNRHTAVSTGVVAVVILACLAFTFRPEPKPEAYYSVDDGKTFFAAGPNIPPFDYRGQEAVKAVVFSCDGGNTKFVGYLMRFTPQGRKKAEEDMRLDRFAPVTGYEVKRPGDKEWVPAADPMSVISLASAKKGNGSAASPAKRFAEITRVTCDDGKGAVSFLPE